MKMSAIVVSLTALCVALSPCAAASIADDEAARDKVQAPGPIGPAQAAPPLEEDAGTPESRLWREIGSLLDELQRLRSELAQARLEAEEYRRELDELRQFIEDHEVYGRDFEQYRGVRDVAEREQRRRDAEAARERHEAQRAERQARAEELRAFREQQRAEARRLRQFREAGFIGLGLNVYVSRVSYHYPTRDLAARLRYDPLIGWHQRYHRVDEMDFSQMTISGAIVNASRETRNVGVALAFFDERGIQVGQETIHITNARPDVPYPFTSTVTMALDRPFSSSTSYVLYADPIDEEYDLE